MKIYRFVPDIRSYGHPWRSGGRWWPLTIDLGEWMNYYVGFPDTGMSKQTEGRYQADEYATLSDFPLLSLQLPILSDHAARQLGCHPDLAPENKLAARLQPISINDARFWAVQPLFAVPGTPEAFVAERSIGLRGSRGDLLQYHTLAFEPSRIPGEWFTISAHEPYAETYVTGDLVERARAAGLRGLDNLELVYDDGPISPNYPKPTTTARERSSYADELWQLFEARGGMLTYNEDELRAIFDDAVLAGLLPS